MGQVPCPVPGFPRHAGRCPPLYQALWDGSMARVSAFALTGWLALEPRPERTLSILACRRALAEAPSTGSGRLRLQDWDKCVCPRRGLTGGTWLGTSRGKAQSLTSIQGCDIISSAGPLARGRQSTWGDRQASGFRRAFHTLQGTGPRPGSRFAGARNQDASRADTELIPGANPALRAG